MIYVIACIVSALIALGISIGYCIWVDKHPTNILSKEEEELETLKRSPEIAETMSKYKENYRSSLDILNNDRAERIAIAKKYAEDIRKLEAFRALLLASENEKRDLYSILRTRNIPKIMLLCRTLDVDYDTFLQFWHIDIDWWEGRK